MFLNLQQQIVVNAELNPICHLLTLLGAHHILHVSRIRVNVWARSLHQRHEARRWVPEQCWKWWLGDKHLTRLTVNCDSTVGHTVAQSVRRRIQSAHTVIPKQITAFNNLWNNKRNSKIRKTI